MKHKIENSRILVLDAFRGIAVLMVIFFHFTNPEIINHIPLKFNYGVTGVDLFFIISGFVIFLTINKVTDWREFVISRFARLYPAYWTSVIFTTLLVYFFHIDNFSIVNSIVNLTMLQSFLKIPHITFVYWTLTVELIFYFLMFILLISKKIGSYLKRVDTLLVIIDNKEFSH